MDIPGYDDSDREIRLICDFLNEQLGFTYNIHKKYLITTRLNKRLNKLGLHNYQSYLNLIKNDIRELNIFFDLLTTNVTSFFREDSQLQILRHELLPTLINLGAGANRLRCWSAGCSSGEEAYTLAIILKETLGMDWDIKVLASDVSVRKLEEGMAGVYSAEKLQDIPAHLRYKYFSVVNTNKEFFKVKPQLRRAVVFRKININQDFEIPSRIQFDLIACRNVFIYLADEVRKKVLEGFYHYLKDGGFLMVGQSEPINLTSSSQWGVLKNCIYQKK
jgi:chemotaxis methyl-accepting protein methylase